MDIGEFTERVRVLREQFTDLLRDHRLETEAATQQDLVDPFLQMMGYPGTPYRIPQYTASIRDKKEEKVDYALKPDGETPAIFVECKQHEASLGPKDVSQLKGYFDAVVSVHIGILTNGTTYKFFSDTEVDNLMDKSSFFEFDIMEINEDQITDLFKFTKPQFLPSRATDTVREMMERDAVRDFLRKELSSPSKQFLLFVLNGVNAPSRTRTVRDRYARYIEEALLHLRGDAQSSPQPVGKEEQAIEPPPALPGGDWRSLDEADEYLKKIKSLKQHAPSLSAMLLPDGSPVENPGWKGVLTETVGWLAREGRLENRLPIGRDGQRYIVNSKDEDPNGEPLRQKKMVAPGVFVETKWDALYCIRNTAFVLEHCDEHRPLRLRWDG